jgi:hypothetical protein
MHYKKSSYVWLETRSEVENLRKLERQKDFIYEILLPYAGNIRSKIRAHLLSLKYTNGFAFVIE